MSDDTKDLRRQELAIGAVSFSPLSPLSLPDDPRAHELETKVRGLAAEIRAKEREQDRGDGAREERQAVVRSIETLQDEGCGEVDDAREGGWQSALVSLLEILRAEEHRKS